MNATEIKNNPTVKMVQHLLCLTLHSGEPFKHWLQIMLAILSCILFVYDLI